MANWSLRKVKSPCTNHASYSDYIEDAMSGNTVGLCLNNSVQDPGVSVKALDVQVGGGHYKKYKIQPIEYIIANNIPYIEGNIIKYITRHKDKGGAEDIKKVIHYCNLILEEVYGKDTNS